MKKKLLIISMLIVIFFIIFIIVNKILNNKENKSTYNLSFKNYSFEVPSDLKYNKIDDYNIKLTSDNWYAELSILYDKYDYILSYPVCTKLRLEYDNYKTGELKKNDGEKNKFIIFTVVDEKEKNVVAYYRIDGNYIMFIDLVNNDNSLNEEGLNTLFRIASSAKRTDENNYSYQVYAYDWYHQCHDVEELDKE